MKIVNVTTSHIQNNKISNKRLYFTSRPDTFSPSVVNTFSDTMKAKFTEKELNRIAKKSEDIQKNAEILAKTKLSGENILDTLLYSFDAKIDAVKIADKVNEVDKLYNDKPVNISLRVNNYDKNVFDIVAVDENKNKKIVTLDKDFKTRSIEDVTYQNVNGKNYEIKKSKDYKEYSEPSDIKGIFNTKRIYNNGKVEQLSSGNIDKKTGIKTVKKDFTSFNGTKTSYEFSEDKEGNRISDYKITDKKGNVLYNNSTAFEIVDENTFISSKNNEQYEIKYSNDDKKLSVKNLKTEEANEIDLHMYIFGNSKKLVPVLKKISGDELIKMGNNVTRLFQIDDDTSSYYHPGRKDINTSDNEYIFLHELGHSKDMKNYDTTTFKTKDATENTLISADKNIVDVYNKEKELFNENMSNAQREHIDYFLKSIGHSSGTNGALKESTAEINAILNTYNTVDRYSMRSEYLQRYFPETIAALAKKL